MPVEFRVRGAATQAQARKIQPPLSVLHLQLSARNGFRYK
jgi:hypothetical protein